MLDTSQRRQVRERIDAELVRLTGEIESLRSLTQPVSPDRAIGRLSRLEAMNERSMNEAALVAAQGLRRRLEATLLRIDEDEFGTCSDCGDVIPLARLLSIPDSRLCVPCRESRES